MKIHLVKALKDNYVYILEDEKTAEAVIIDPGEAKPVSDFISKYSLKPSFIINTHHHYDHVDGNEELKKNFQLQIITSEYDFHRVPGADRFLKDQECIQLTPEIKLQALMVPGHTLGHMALYCEEHHSLFSGDTLFSLGCGRLFEGTPEMMFNSLQKIKGLPKATQIYCGHEYTLKNLEFTRKQKDSESLKTLFEEVTLKTKKEIPTLPTTLAHELEYNLFLKAKTANEFAQIREKRDHF